MIISIGGKAGSGKTTIAKMLAEKLGWPLYFIGKIRRAKAAELNMTLEEYNKYGETHAETDLEVDEYQKQLGLTEDNFVIEGRTSFYFIPHSIKIFFEVDDLAGATRAYGEQQQNSERRKESRAQTIEEVLTKIKERNANDAARYKKYYDLDFLNHGKYDLVVDTSELTTEQVFDRVWRYINQKQTEIDPVKPDSN